MAQLKRYNGTSWETIGGSIAPKNTHTSSTTDTYSCDYVNDLNTYSTTEIRIGTWLGKPLYRKVFNVNSISTSNTDLVNITSLNYSQIVKVYGMLNTDNNQHFPIPLTDSSANYSVIFATSTALRGRAAVGSGNFANAWLAVEYTKTTD